MEDNKIKQIIAEGLKDGQTLNEIHRVLSSEHQVKITFMELRLLSTEIEDADWSQFDPQPPEEEPEEETDVEEESDPATEDQAVGESDAEGTQIEVSKIQRPGTMVSGMVTFLSGVKGEWYLDQMGQLGLGLEDESKQPTEEDMEDFQINLKRILSGG